MPQLTDAQRAVIDSTPIVVLSTLGPQGAPQTTAVWFVLGDDGQVTISLNGSRQKLKNLQRNPEASLLFINAQNPYQTVELRGTATVAPDTDGTVIDAVNAKYGANVRDHDGPGEQRYAATFAPEKVLTFGV